MSTRSAVGVWVGNPSEGKLNARYHHSDGYPSGMGQFLYNQIKNENINIHQLVETITSEKVGWSFFLDKDMRMPPVWTNYGEAGVCHVRQQVGNRINKMFQRFIERNEDKPFFITDQELIKKNVEQDEYEEKFSFGGKSRVPTVITLKVYDEETYEPVTELAFNSDHPAYLLAKYLYYFAPLSCWQRGEDFDLDFEKIEDFKDSDIEYIYLFDLVNSKLWIYSNPWKEFFEIDMPLLVIDFNETFDGDWELVSDGKYQKPIQLA